MKDTEFIYTYIRHRDEHDLCRMEMRSFFGIDTPSNVLKSTIAIDPSRSPFIHERLEILFEEDQLEQLIEQIGALDLGDSTFKVICMNTTDFGTTKKITHAERRKIERTIGLQIQGEPEFEQPEIIFGVMELDEKWYFGKLTMSDNVWFHHQQKPHMYSTALSTRVARAVVNIAVPHPKGVRAIDPCCGIGTVLVEALSMGIPIVGRDINWRVVQGSRKNIAHFGLDGDVTAGPIADVTEDYDVAIIDMPYDLFTHITPEGQLEIIKEARRFTKKIVIVTVDTIDDMINEAGFQIKDRCLAKKGTFSRQVLICE